MSFEMAWTKRNLRPSRSSTLGPSTIQNIDREWEIPPNRTVSQDPTLQLATVLENLNKTLSSLDLGRTSLAPPVPPAKNYGNRIPNVPRNP
jgi:hypothetical protein